MEGKKDGWKKDEEKERKKKEGWKEEEEER